MSDAATNQLLTDYIKERKRARRWGLFFKLLILAFVIFMASPVWLAIINRKPQAPHVALIDIRGLIADDKTLNGSADNVAASLRAAYKNAKVEAVILRINSPGGSPVQANYIFKEIRRLKKLHPEVKIYGVCTDICASAAYYIAAATDAIYADPSSLVGSIGVMFNGFGFVDTLQKLGIQRRLLISGRNKGFLDPFSPMKPADQTFLQKMLNGVHKEFIASVITGRGKRLKINENTFSGLAWNGRQAKPLGLIDGFGSAGSVARDVIHNEKILNYTVRPNYLQNLIKRFGSSLAGGFSNQLGLGTLIK